MLGQFLSDQPPDSVDLAARRERNDHANRPRRVDLGACCARKHLQRDSTRRQWRNLRRASCIRYLGEVRAINRTRATNAESGCSWLHAGSRLGPANLNLSCESLLEPGVHLHLAEHRGRGI
jgi:hypothetical protein